MCYSCNGCGQCGNGRVKKGPSREDLPGFCKACGKLNGPESAACGWCGAELGRVRLEVGWSEKGSLASASRVVFDKERKGESHVF